MKKRIPIPTKKRFQGCDRGDMVAITLYHSVF